MFAVVFYAVLALSALIVLTAFVRSGHCLRSLAASLVQGCISLLAVHVAGSVTGVVIPVNPYTLGAVGVLGLPGTIALVLTDLILRLRQ